jgi:hypothetical protein
MSIRWAAGNDRSFLIAVIELTRLCGWRYKVRDARADFWSSS